MPYVTNEEYLDLLESRVKFWIKDLDVVSIYMKMYENLIDCGCFEDNKHTIAEIVDNDIVNWTSVLYIMMIVHLMNCLMRIKVENMM